MEIGMHRIIEYNYLKLDAFSYRERLWPACILMKVGRAYGRLYVQAGIGVRTRTISKAKDMRWRYKYPFLTTFVI